ncbi:CocE/NonD family hydrolase [Streptomyces sp. I05A-00742]|uniref:CocE/NonD family hydrolase n=1 Tax=Streptomyces sp. I05A-00742 TaxID=2732853 RepID=UPI001487BA94|nr:CocE/NonD family hydrolase [Streptomyces sp. I05A-00742]
METLRPRASAPRPARGAARRRRPWRSVAAALAGLLLSAVCVAPGAVHAASAPPVTWRPVVIPGGDGVPLRGSVAAPRGGGPHPLIVMTRSWIMSEAFFSRTQLAAASRGYVVVIYAPRGMGGSGGTMDMGGPKDVADVRSVVTWSLAHTPADARHIGATGLSYGASVSLLGAAFDPRIRSVTALSSWTDMYDVFQDNGTPAETGYLAALYGGLHGASGASSPVSGLFPWDARRLAAWAGVRSPETYLDRYNAQGTAVFLAQAWGDKLTPVGRRGEFFDRLRGRKRLEMRPGGHGGAEFSSSVMPNEVIDSAMRWFDHTLKDRANGVAEEPPVLIRPVNSGPLFGVGHGFEGHPSWSAMTGPPRRLVLSGGGSLRDGPGAPASRARLVAGPGTVLDGEHLPLQNTVEALLGARVPRPLALVPRGAGAVWTGYPSAAVRQVRGTPRVHLTITPSSSRGTVVTYLYDVDALGNGTLMSYAPYTFRGRAPGSPFTAGFRLHATAYDVPKGHRLALVATTADSWFRSLNPPGSALTLSSSPASPSWVEVPSR